MDENAVEQVVYDMWGMVDPALPLGTCGTCQELHNRCSRTDWREEKPF